MLDVFRHAAETVQGDMRDVTAVEQAPIAGVLVVGISYAFYELT
jgi:hypothetical protein